MLEKSENMSTFELQTLIGLKRNFSCYNFNEIVLKHSKCPLLFVNAHQIFKAAKDKDKLKNKENNCNF